MNGLVDTRISGVIFDLDGTLSNTWPPAMAAFRAAIAEFSGRAFSEEELRGYAGPAEDGILQELFPEKWEAAFERYLVSFDQRLKDGQIVFPGVLEALELLRIKGKKMAIVSGKTKKAVEMALHKGRIDGFFDQVRGGWAGGDRKESDLSATIESWGISPSSVAYVGDTQGDVAAARCAGLTAVGVCWAEHAHQRDFDQMAPDYLFSSTQELKDWIATL